ncbi:hypothetical protein [Paraburkholderia ultramafica]|uniref:hypothetical protein n=1 Tax=Paraburkholderia ultramafica TaxID=1544867 RepID=UPI001581853C|nr:hypothetical protein [Paraburkholderia ultramafica]
MDKMVIADGFPTLAEATAVHPKVADIYARYGVVALQGIERYKAPALPETEHADFCGWSHGTGLDSRRLRFFHFSCPLADPEGCIDRRQAFVDCTSRNQPEALYPLAPGKSRTSP